MSHQLFSLYGYFNHKTFINIVITASGIKDFEFINSFLTQSLPKLKTTYRSKCKQLGQAYKDFAKRDYANANQKVLFLEDKTIFFSLRARFLALRCNFEFLMEDFNQEEPFSSHCQSFKIFINKQHKSLSAFRRDSYLNHIKILENIAKSILLTGHIDFKKSKELGNKLIVIVNNDTQAILKKGKPFMKCKERVKIIRELECVDMAIEDID